MTDGPAWHLQIAAGPNTGAAFCLAPGSYVIGTDSTSDIVLSDNTISARAAMLHIGATSFTVTTGDGGSASKPIRTYRSDRRTRAFQIGATRFLVAGPQCSHLKGKSRLASLTIFSMVMVGTPIPLIGSVPSPAPIAPVDKSVVAAAPILTGDPMTLLSDATTAMAGFSIRLNASHVASGVHLAVVDGAVSAEGRVARDQAQGWLAAKQWFDAQFGQSVVLIDETTFIDAAPDPRLKISAVRSGPVRYIITESGEKLGEGAITESGWVIMSISIDQVVLAKDGTRIELRL